MRRRIGFAARSVETTAMLVSTPVANASIATAANTVPHARGLAPGVEAEIGDSLTPEQRKIADAKLAIARQEIAHPGYADSLAATKGGAQPQACPFTPVSIVWKEVQPPMSVATWGTLYRYSIATSTLRAMYFDTEDRLDYQAAGNRYVTGWEWFDDTLRAYDLRSDTSLVIESHPPAPTSPIGLHMAVVAGDLLVYIRGDSSKPGGKNKWLCYVQLPPG